MSSINQLLNLVHNEIARLRQGVRILTETLIGERPTHQRLPVLIRTLKRRQSS